LIKPPISNRQTYPQILYQIIYCIYFGSSN